MTKQFPKFIHPRYLILKDLKIFSSFFFDLKLTTQLTIVKYYAFHDYKAAKTTKLTYLVLV